MFFHAGGPRTSSQSQLSISKRDLFILIFHVQPSGSFQPPPHAATVFEPFKINTSRKCTDADAGAHRSRTAPGRRPISLQVRLPHVPLSFGLRHGRATCAPAPGCTCSKTLRLGDWIGFAGVCKMKPSHPFKTRRCRRRSAGGKNRLTLIES